MAGFASSCIVFMLPTIPVAKSAICNWFCLLMLSSNPYAISALIMNDSRLAKDRCRGASGKLSRGLELSKFSAKRLKSEVEQILTIYKNISPMHSDGHDWKTWSFPGRARDEVHRARRQCTCLEWTSGGSTIRGNQPTSFRGRVTNHLRFKGKDETNLEDVYGMIIDDRPADGCWVSG